MDRPILLLEELRRFIGGTLSYKVDGIAMQATIAYVKPEFMDGIPVPVNFHITVADAKAVAGQGPKDPPNPLELANFGFNRTDKGRELILFYPISVPIELSPIISLRLPDNVRKHPK
jgi:hypothetical protein